MFKNVVTDVDGVLTDGGFYYSSEGKILKKFGPHDSDGFAILKEAGIKPIAITADKRGFPISEKRLNDMHVDIFLVPADTRFSWLCKNFKLEETIFVGDGYFDIPCIQGAKLGVAPRNAPALVRERADFVTKASGGNGVIFELALRLEQMDV